MKVKRAKQSGGSGSGIAGMTQTGLDAGPQKR